MTSPDRSFCSGSLPPITPFSLSFTFSCFMPDAPIQIPIFSNIP